MLRLWRDVLRVVVAPRQLTLVRTTRLRAQVIAARVSDVPDSEAGDGRLAVQLLQEMARETAWQGTDVRIVLSNRLARFMVTPALNTTLDKLDSTSIASHYFKDAYGEIAATWACRLDDAGGRIAMAVDRALIDAITQCFAGADYRLRAVQPALSVGFNCWRRSFGLAAQWFAMTEAEHACLCLLQGGEWQQVRGIDAGDSEELPTEIMRAIAREQVLAGLEQAPELLSMLALDGRHLEMPGGSEVRLQRLTLPRASNSNQSVGIALALAA